MNWRCQQDSCAGTVLPVCLVSPYFPVLRRFVVPTAIKAKSKQNQILWSTSVFSEVPSATGFFNTGEIGIAPKDMNSLTFCYCAYFCPVSLLMMRHKHWFIAKTDALALDRFLPHQTMFLSRYARELGKCITVEEEFARQVLSEFFFCLFLGEGGSGGGGGGTSLFHWEFLPQELHVSSLGKASCDRVAPPGRLLKIPSVVRTSEDFQGQGYYGIFRCRGIFNVTFRWIVPNSVPCIQGTAFNLRTCFFTAERTGAAGAREATCAQHGKLTKTEEDVE